MGRVNDKIIGIERNFFDKSLVGNVAAVNPRIGILFSGRLCQRAVLIDNSHFPPQLGMNTEKPLEDAERPLFNETGGDALSDLSDPDQRNFFDGLYRKTGQCVKTFDMLRKGQYRKPHPGAQHRSSGRNDGLIIRFDGNHDKNIVNHTADIQQRNTVKPASRPDGKARQLIRRIFKRNNIAHRAVFNRIDNCKRSFLVGMHQKIDPKRTILAGVQ